MAVIGSLSVKLGLVTVEWDQATKKAKQDAKELQKSFDDLSGNIKTLYGHWKTLGGAMSLSAVGLGALIQQTLEFADSISDLAKGFDLTIGKTLQFRDAIKQSGGNAEGASKILSTLFSKIQDARSGNEAAISQFEQIGLSFEELSRLKPDEALERVFKALGDIGSTYERVKAVKDLLGKQGIGVDVDAVAQKLSMSTAKFDMYAKNIEKVGQVNDDLAATFDNLKIAFADMIGPLTREGVVSVEKFKAAMVGLTAATVVSGLMQIVSLSAKLIEIWKSGAKVQAALTAMGGLKGMIQLGAATAAYFAAKKMFEDEAEAAVEAANDAKADGATAPEKKDDGKAEKLVRREQIANAAKLAYAKKMIQFAKEEGDIKLDGLTTDKYSIQLREINLTQAREIATAENQRAQALNKENLSNEQKGQIQRDYQKAVELADTKANAQSQLVIRQREKEIALIGQKMAFSKQLEQFEQDRIKLESDRYYMTENEYRLANETLNSKRKVAELEQQIKDAKSSLGEGKTYEAEKARIEDLIRAENDLSEARKRGIEIDEYRRTSMTEGFNEAVRKFAADAENYGKLGADMFGAAIGNMNNAIDNFVRTGKLAFKDFAKSVIQDIMAMILKFQAMQLVVMAMRAMGVPIPMGSMGGASVPAKASGGDIDGPTLVGENGPEIFVPQRRGSVIPNTHATTFMQQQQPATVFNGPYIQNMQAIDTQSAAQFLAKNKDSVWAANQSASRSIPTSR